MKGQQARETGKTQRWVGGREELKGTTKQRTEGRGVARQKQMEKTDPNGKRGRRKKIQSGGAEQENNWRGRLKMVVREKNGSPKGWRILNQPDEKRG